MPVRSSTPEYSRSYVYAGSRLLSTAINVSGTEVIEFHHPDRLGTRLVTNPGAGTYYEQSTLPFGTALGAESTGFSNQVFTSYDRSASTGLDYAVNRTYSQGQSRFTTVDPIGMAAASLGDPQSLNMFAYVQNMPTDFVDPLGLYLLCFGWWVMISTDGGVTWTNTGTFIPSFCIEVGGPPSPDGGETGGGNTGGNGGGNGNGESQGEDDTCLDKLNAVLEILLGKRAFGKLENKGTGTTGFEALMANFIESDRMIEISEGPSNYNIGTRTISIITNPSRSQWGITVDIIHEGLHGARRSGFNHEQIFRAMAKVSGIDFRQFTRDRREQLRSQGIRRPSDDNLYRDAINRWIRDNCGE